MYDRQTLAKTERFSHRPCKRNKPGVLSRARKDKSDADYPKENIAGRRGVTKKIIRRARAVKIAANIAEGIVVVRGKVIIRLVFVEGTVRLNSFIHYFFNKT